MSLELLIKKAEELPEKLTELGMDGRGIAKYKIVIPEIISYIKANNIESQDKLIWGNFIDTVDDTIKNNPLYKSIASKVFKYLKDELDINEMIRPKKKKYTKFDDVRDIGNPEEDLPVGAVEKEFVTELPELEKLNANSIIDNIEDELDPKVSSDITDVNNENIEEKINSIDNINTVIENTSDMSINKDIIQSKPKPSQKSHIKTQTTIKKEDISMPTRKIMKETDILGLDSKVRIYKRDNYGKLITIGDYTIKEIAPDGDLEAFMNDYIVPKYGGGIYEIYKYLSSGQLKPIKTLRFAGPVDDKEPHSVERIYKQVEYIPDSSREQELGALKELLYKMISKTMEQSNNENPETVFTRYQLIKAMIKDIEKAEQSGDMRYIDKINERLSKLEEMIIKSNETNKQTTGIDINTLMMKDMINEIMETIKELKASKEKKEEDRREDTNYRDREHKINRYDRYNRYETPFLDDPYEPPPYYRSPYTRGYYPPPYPDFYPPRFMEDDDVDVDKKIEEVKKEFDEKMYKFKEELKNIMTSMFSKDDDKKTDFVEILKTASPLLMQLYQNRVEEQKRNSEKFDQLTNMLLTQIMKMNELMLTKQNTNSNNNEYVNILLKEIEDLKREINNTKNKSSIYDIAKEIKAVKEVANLLGSNNNTNNNAGLLDKIINIIDKMPQAVNTINMLQKQTQQQTGQQNEKSLPVLNNSSNSEDNIVATDEYQNTNYQIDKEQLHHTLINIIKNIKKSNPEQLNEVQQLLFDTNGNPNEEGIKALLSSLNIPLNKQIIGNIVTILNENKDEYMKYLNIESSK